MELELTASSDWEYIGTATEDTGGAFFRAVAGTSVKISCYGNYKANGDTGACDPTWNANTNKGYCFIHECPSSSIETFLL